MREERLRDEKESQPSASRIVVVTGSAAAVVLLICGGAASYVALTPRDRPAEPAPPRGPTVTNDPEKIVEIAQRVFGVDVPADFEPLDADNDPSVRRAQFGRRSGEGALLKIARVAGPLAARVGDSEAQQQRLLRLIDAASPPSNLTGESGSAPEATERELTVLGSPVRFRFSKGKMFQSQTAVCKVSGSFQIEAGPAVLIYTIPDAEFDEESVVRMIESIRPPVK